MGGGGIYKLKTSHYWKGSTWQKMAFDNFEIENKPFFPLKLKLTLPKTNIAPEK